MCSNKAAKVAAEFPGLVWLWCILSFIAEHKKKKNKPLQKIRAGVGPAAPVVVGSGSLSCSPNPISSCAACGAAAREMGELCLH